VGEVSLKKDQDDFRILVKDIVYGMDMIRKKVWSKGDYYEFIADTFKRLNMQEDYNYFKRKHFAYSKNKENKWT
jgi:hypothetical protein